MDTAVSSGRANNVGSDNTIIFNGNGGGVFYFDLSSIRPGVPIYAATLTLYLEDPGSFSGYHRPSRVYQIVDPNGYGLWTEGEATWSERRDGVPWTSGGSLTSGVDLSTESNFYPMNSEGGKWKEGYAIRTNVAKIVQNWIDGGQTNHGFWVEDLGSDRPFHTRESSDAQWRPQLEITYGSANHNPPPPVSNLQGEYRNGQVFLTWTEISGDEPTYHVYRSRDKFDSPGSLLRADYLGLVRQGSSRNNERSRVEGGDKYWVIKEGDGALSSSTGYFVDTVEAPGDWYYCVIAADNGTENNVDIRPQRILVRNCAVAEPEPVIQWQDSDQILFGHWATENQSHILGMGFNFEIKIPDGYTPAETVGLGLGLGGRGSQYDDSPATSHSHIQIRPSDDIYSSQHCHEIGSNGGCHRSDAWWTGYNELWDTGRNPADGVVRFYTENRLLAYVDFVKRDSRWTIDPTKVFIKGHSMGGTGSLHVGLGHPDVFASIHSHQPLVNWDDYDSNSNGGFESEAYNLWGEQPEGTVGSPVIYNERGVRHLSHMDAGWRVLHRRGQDIPVPFVYRGRSDLSIVWGGFPGVLADFQAARHHIVAAWDNGSHGSCCGRVDQLDTFDHRTDESYPALTYYSHNPNPGNGDPASGDQEGVYNYCPTWDLDTVTDQNDRWEVDLFLRPQHSLDSFGTVCTENSGTIDVTPRRLQTFSITPGDFYAWENLATNASGVVQADNDGLIVVPDFALTKSASRLRVTASTPEAYQEWLATQEDDEFETASTLGVGAFEGLAVDAQPNPFRSRTELRFNIAEPTAAVKVTVHDVQGRLIDTLVEGPRSPGEHAVAWNGRDAQGANVAAGIYFVRLQAGRQVETRKVVRLD